MFLLMCFIFNCTILFFLFTGGNKELMMFLKQSQHVFPFFELYNFLLWSMRVESPGNIKLQAKTKHVVFIGGVEEYLVLVKKGRSVEI